MNVCSQDGPEASADWDEDDPSLSFADKQAVRLGKVRQVVLDPNFQVARCAIILLLML